MNQRATFIAALLLFLLPAGCTSLFFKPGKKHVPNAEVQALEPQDVRFRSGDGTGLHGWYFRGRGERQRGTILVCHGNVENISTHAKLDLWLVREGFNVFIFDYRGYGLSEGETTVEGIHLDAAAALETVATLPGADDRVIVYGKSLGGAVAVHAVATSPFRGRVRGLVIEGAFADYRMIARDKIARSIIGWPLQAPLSWLVNNDYSPLAFIPAVAPVPLLILHGSDDAIVPVRHGRMLAQAAPGPALYWELDGLGHVKSWTDGAVRARLLGWLDGLP